jgi:hypothetical protein
MRPRYKGRRAIALKLFVKVKEKTGMDFSLGDDIITVCHSKCTFIIPHLFRTFMVNFATFPTTLLTFEAQNKVGISHVFPLLLLPDLQFHRFLFLTSPTFSV